jgi:signal transduction histidine kinase
VIERLKAYAKRRWPALRLRTILFAVLLFAAAMPGISAIGLRVYENSLVRQTEAELIAQGAALAAVAQSVWPGAAAPPTLSQAGRPAAYRPEPTTVDLNTAILPERPRGAPSFRPADPAAVVASRALDPVFHRTSLTTLASIVLVDSQGRVVRGREAGSSYAHVAEVRSALGGRTDTRLRRNGEYRPRYSLEWLSRASGLRIHHARPIVVQGEVVGALLLSRSPRALFKGVYQDRGKIMLGIAVIFTILLVLAGLVSRAVTRPIEALSAATRDVAAGRAAMPDTPATAAIEIRALYEDFRAMAEATARRSRYLRDFAAAISHEFKTPLAGMSGAIELLEDHHASMSEAERRTFLRNISADAERLSRLVTRLLDLARADMAQPGMSASAGLVAPLRRVADALRRPGFDVELALPASSPRVAVPESTLEAVLTTLIENSRQAGAGRVLVSAAADRGVVRLSVKDDGPGVPEADRDRVFEPFFTSRRAEGGTGLGLPIARSLLAASEGTINLVQANAGALFELRLPVARNAVAGAAK